jgi:asparagine synthase (glutamine-hydrolysing)
MCGIVGTLGPGTAQIGAQIVARMNATIKHRGPDDSGTWITDGAAVAMRRLSIIDLAGGHQPMVTDDGVVIVFNGEVYNYVAIREKLQRAGYRFRTTSDTEVVLNLYHYAGIAGLEELEGMYGICIVDTRHGEVHLMRDRVGIKPLYYGTQQGQFYFASEIKAILAGMPVRPEPNPEAIFHYLSLRYVPGPDTVWTGIHKLQPGHRLTYRLADGSWNIHRYWQFRFASEPLDSSRDYQREFQRLFLGAVNSHLTTSDVPVGILLSGGLDSSAVAAASVELGIRGLQTFSVAFKDGGHLSELSYARQVAKHIGADHYEVEIDERQFLDFLDDFVWHADEPLADLASIPLYYVSHLARQHVKVVLSGEGADEILAGYDLEKRAEEADRRERLLSWMPRWAFRLGSWCFQGQRSVTLRTMADEGWSGYVMAWAAHPTSVHWTDVEKRALWRGGIPNAATSDLIRSWYHHASSPAPVDKLQHVSCHEWLVEDLLMKADKMTMANSIELRVPYLDRSLVEWAQTLPLRWKVGDRANKYVSKYILRSFAAKRLPHSIIERPKQGFPIPVYEWLQGRLGQWAEKRLEHSNSGLGRWIHMTGIAPTLAAARNGNIAAAHSIWVLIVLDAWTRRWL